MSILSDRAVGLLDYLKVDAESDELLQGLVEGMLSPADRLSLVCHGDGTIGPLAAVTDPGVAPDWALPYAAQWTGGVMPKPLPGETPEEYIARARQAVIQPGGMKRGGPLALKTAALPYLTGTKTCNVVELYDGDLWQIALLTRKSETPDLEAVTTAINHPDVITAGMKATVEYFDEPWIIALFEAVYYHKTVSHVEADFTTVHELEEYEVT